MADDAGTRLRNVSDYGDIEVPDLGIVVEARHEVVVEDDDLAQRLIDTGAFIAVNKPGPKPGGGSSGDDAAGAGDAGGDTGNGTTPPTPPGAGTDTTSTGGTDQ